MEKVVSIARSNSLQSFVLNPMGMFRGYGGLVGINPYRELPPDVDARVLGETVIELLAASVMTGFRIDQMDEYRETTADSVTTQIRARYLSGIRSTKQMARDFRRTEVSLSSTGKSWTVTGFKFDAKTDTFLQRLKRRVLVSEGATLLGQTVLDSFMAADS